VGVLVKAEAGRRDVERARGVGEVERGQASQDRGLGDGTIMLTLPFKLRFVGADTPDFVMGGDLQVGE